MIKKTNVITHINLFDLVKNVSIKIYQLSTLDARLEDAFSNYDRLKGVPKAMASTFAHVFVKFVSFTIPNKDKVK